MSCCCEKRRSGFRGALKNDIWILNFDGEALPLKESEPSSNLGGSTKNNVAC